MKTQQRLLGIDLFRGLAIFGVVLLHADGSFEQAQLPWLWHLIRQIFAFAVPFFLATSFYFAVAKSQKGKLSFYPRLKRLLLPYLIWTLLYLGYKATKYILDGEATRIKTLVQDPFSLIFCGGAAFHLYFLPLLLWGICLVKLLELGWFKQMKLEVFIFSLVISLGINNLIVISGNGFQIDSGMAFTNLFDNQGLFRLFLVLTAWTFWCLPYILVSKTAHELKINKLLKKINLPTVIWLIIGFFCLAWLDFWWIPIPLSEVTRGYITLCLGIYFSQQIKASKWLVNLGNSSLGIYLIHLIFVESFYIISNRLNSEILQPSTTLLIGISIGAFVLSWLVTLLLLNTHKNTRLILGF